MRNLKFLRLKEKVVIKVQQDIQIMFEDGDANGDGFPPSQSTSLPRATESDSNMESIQEPSTSLSLSLPSSPTPKTLSNPPSQFVHCGCKPFADRSPIRICRPCYDLSSDDDSAFSNLEVQPELVTPGVVAVVAVLLFLVAVALVDLSHWVWNRLHRQPISLSECEKGNGVAIEDDEDLDKLYEDDQLIP
ncbi:hypothetical protein D8B26_002759 [Coccidioides posadasii str. Silveira]|uniref:Uncharacterized protein n=2 Tax=Coccidioides posadasii TaxID=199306 RepID=E9CYD4_COCPS|nr:conserved hypothetical protein [Coccidioides posadasii str. Silveira]KMM72486.1 hypothetical protein CPAG_08780 [Coccidioides posadasii RMSCC 3488]QVM08062.1 hypothetical protein D8B26_002759 [Coccidioides posadasii str. Silveira]